MCAMNMTPLITSCSAVATLAECDQHSVQTAVALRIFLFPKLHMLEAYCTVGLMY